MYKGYPSQEKDNGLGSQFVTIAPLREKQWALDVRAALWVESIGNKTVAAGSTTTVVTCTNHGARQGDLIRFTSGSQSGKEISVAKIIDANNFQVGETMSAAPLVGDLFTLERFRHPLVDPTTGGILMTPGPEQFVRNGVNQQVTQDTVTPANNRPFPVQLIDTTGPISQGQKAMANSLPVAIASDQGAIAAKLEDGAGNNITSQANGTQRALDVGVNVAGVQVDPRAIRALTNADVVKAQLQDNAGTGVTVGQKAMASSLPVTISSDQSAVPASQSGTWNQRLQDGSGNAITSQANGTQRALDIGVNVAGVQVDPRQIRALTNSDVVKAQLQDNAGTAVTVGQKLMASSLPVTLASDQSAVPASQSGTWNMRLQDGAGSAVNKGQVTMAASLPVALASDQSAIPTKLQDGSGSAVNKGQANMAGSLPVVIASDQTVVPTKAPVNANGSGSAASATVSTAATLTAPANAVGFILQNLDTSTANIRWCIGRTASATLGQQAQPGRDTGFVPCGANVSICAESGTQNYDIQWISQ